MTLETWLFLIIGGIAIASAMLMLLSENAVHSALFLIVVMGCIAFLFLMLEAPFLAMVQIAVYAGAIMVLFLFVIMLLGAEKAEVIEPQNARRFKWQPVLALVFAGSFLALAALAIIQGKIDLQTPGSQPAMLRFGHFATDARPFDVYVGEELAGASPVFREVSEFITLPAGEYTVNIVPAGQPSTAVLAGITVTLEAGRAATVLAYGEGRLPVLGVVNQEMSSVPDRSARLVVFNAYSSDVSLVQINSEIHRDSRNIDAIIPNVAVGTSSEAQIIEEGSMDWAFIAAGEEAAIINRDWNGIDALITRLNNYEVSRGSSQLLVLTGERLFDNSIRPFVETVVSPAWPAFGSPQAIGFALFTTYMLPFQMIAMLLLVAMIGALVLTHKESVAAPRRRDVRRVVSRPLTSVIASQIGSDVTKPTGEDAAEAAPSGD